MLPYLRKKSTCAGVRPKRSADEILLADALLTYPVSTSFPLAYLFVFGAAAFILLYAGIRGLLPYVFMLPPMLLVRTADHHAGLLFIALLGCLWIAFNAKAGAGTKFFWLDAPFAALFAIILLLQIGWSYNAVHTDHNAPYDPGKETTSFLKANAVGKTVVGVDFMTTSVQPYFAHSPFANRPEAFWT